MKILLLGYVQDLQTGVYIIDACENLKHTVNWVDIRATLHSGQLEEGQKRIIEKIEEVPTDIDLIIVLKGTELSYETIKYVKNKFKNANLVNWFFDVYYMNKPIWEDIEYLKTIKLFDYYFCSVGGVVDELKRVGINNAYYLEEACSPKHNGEQLLNNFQKRKYSSDISFIGNLGYLTQHANRIKIINKVLDEGFDLKIWGKIVCAPKYLSHNILKSHTYTPAINEQHSMVVQSSLINLGIDQNPLVYKGHSARLYRVMCAGGLYLVNGTKGLEEIFKVNKPGEEINETQDLVLYYNEDDLIEKLDFLLAHPKICEQIRLNGQKKVLERDTFEQRINEMENIIKKC